MNAPAITTHYRESYAPPAFVVDEIFLTLSLAPQATRVEAELKCRRLSSDSTEFVLFGEDLALHAIALDGIALTGKDYRIEPGRLILTLCADEFTVRIVNEIAPAENTKLEGLYLSNGIYCTQCEAEGFRRITYFPDRPDVMSRYTTRIIADKQAAPILLGNGNLVASGDLADGQHFAEWHDPWPKPSYLFACVAGQLDLLEDHFTTRSGRQVALRIYADPGHAAACAYAMDSLKRCMRWDEERFGLEYDLDLFNIVAISDFNMGAMENKSLNIFNAKYILADPETATDDDHAHIEAVVAHEYFHNWTGNRVTCRDWFQLSLKEGLTVFRDQEFSADMRSRPVKRIQDVRGLRAHQFPEDNGPLAHPVRPDSYIEINNFYTTTVYEKGAEVVGMLQTILGRDSFRAGLDLYFQRHDGQAVTCDDFVAAMADANAIDLEQFKLWYSQAGTPRLHVQQSYDAAAQQCEITVTQHCPPTPDQPKKEPMAIPLRLALLDDQGAPLALKRDGANQGPQEDVLLLQHAEQSFLFEDIDAAPTLSFNRHFAAPVICHIDNDKDQLAFAMRHETDAFNRWDAGQRLATSILLDRIAGSHDASAGSLIKGIAAILDDSTLEPAFVAEAVRLPSESMIADAMAVVDVDAVHQQHRNLSREIADALLVHWQTLYDQYRISDAYSPDATQAGKRALRNRAMAYLSVAPRGPGDALAGSHYDTADNMTDRWAALMALNENPGEIRDAAVADFYQRFQNHDLVIDKWLALQAAAQMPGALQHVENLLDHPAFDLKKPNKVRALIGAFAHNNPTGFHAADGAGYAFIADQILAIDRLNPQIAARLAQAFRQWRRFDDARQSRMAAQMQRIRDTKDLSRDVFEITDKMLR